MAELKHFPKLNSQYFEDFNLNDCLDMLIDNIEFNLNEKFFRDDIKLVLQFILEKLKKINNYIKNDVRFDYLQLQHAIDNLYQEDEQINGVHVKFVFKTIPEQPDNFGHLTYNLKQISK